MKIQKISYVDYPKPSFKSHDKYIDFDDDCGTYYNQISIKDAFISASILSGILMLGGSLVANCEKIPNLFFKGKEQIRKLVELVLKNK